MKNLQEMSLQEMRETEGGFLVAFFLGFTVGVIAILIKEAIENL